MALETARISRPQVETTADGAAKRPPAVGSRAVFGRIACWLPMTQRRCFTEEIRSEDWDKSRYQESYCYNTGRAIDTASSELLLQRRVSSCYSVE